MKDQQVLIAGGTGGLGTSVVTAILERGATVFLPYYRESEAERLKQHLTDPDLKRTHFIAADLRNEFSVQQLVDRMERIDALIQLVGGFAMGKTHEYSFDAWKDDLDLNLNITFLLCKHSLRRMLETGYGRIVTIGSRGAVEPGAQLAAYCASKAGVVALTKSIAAETKGTNITANVVLPSVIDTPANRAAMGDEMAKQWVKPESLAEVICFLASDAARDIRGAAIPVYGNA